MQISRFDRCFNLIIRIILVLTAILYIFIPIVGISWIRLPFPGFMLEQTLVVNSIRGENWSGKTAGIDFPQRLLSIQGKEIQNLREYYRIISKLEPGKTIPIQATDPLGSIHLFPQILIMNFPEVDSFRLLWLPYLVGLIYLVSAFMVYRVRGNTRPGDAYVFTALTGAISIGLIFDLSTTHLGPIIWTIAIAHVGGTLIALSLLFPEEIQPFRRRAWFRLIAHSLSISLALWGLLTLYNQSDPWAYVLPWRWSYIYAGIGFIIFLVMMAYRLKQTRATLAYQQARIIFWGSLIAFAPLAIWFVFQIVAPSPISTIFMLAPLIVFPVVVGLAVIRYRLWDIDLIIRKTLVYSILMSLLSLVYLTSIVLLSVFIGAISMNTVSTTSPIILVISTLAVITLFSPLRVRVQNIIDHKFYREHYDSTIIVENFSMQVRNAVNLDQICDDLLVAVDDTMHPRFVSLWIKPEYKKIPQK